MAQKRSKAIPADLTPPHIPVRVIDFQCAPFNPFRWVFHDEYFYILTFAEPANNEEQEAFIRLRRALRWERQRRFYYPYEAEPYMKTGVIEGKGYVWKLHAEIVRQFAPWFAFEKPLDFLMACANVAYQAQAEEWHARGERAKRRRDLLDQPGRVSAAQRLFGLDETATRQDLKKRYHELAKQHHPDVGGDAEQFRRVSQAYQTLCDWWHIASTPHIGSALGS